MAKHLALGHSKLDELLADKELVAKKRELVFNKPKKQSIGASCPVCDLQFNKGQNRDHVSWHFMEELRDYVATFPSQKECKDCTYMTDKTDNLVKHVALGHCKLDDLLEDKELVESKRNLFKSKTKKISVGKTCPICNVTFSKNQNRDHVAWHFMEDLKDIINQYADKSQCPLCEYYSEKSKFDILSNVVFGFLTEYLFYSPSLLVENMAKHLALGHSKLDEFMSDADLVQKKREIAMNKPKKFVLGELCPVCDFVGPSREHVARHFMDELLELADDPKKLSCSECDYK